MIRDRRQPDAHHDRDEETCEEVIEAGHRLCGPDEPWVPPVGHECDQDVHLFLLQQILGS